MQPVPFPPIYELEPKASQLMDVLVELGHLDEKLLNQINHSLAQLAPPLNADGIGTIRLSDVRRITAEAIFDGMSDLEGEALRTMKREWGFLFY
jgi:hypothetical protein